MYVEYYVKDSYFDFSNYEKSVAGLETLTLSLYSGNLNDEYMTWKLDV